MGLQPVVQHLLKAGAYPSVTDNFGRTPLLESVRGSHVTTAKLLFEHGAVLGMLERPEQMTTTADLMAGAEMCQAAFQGKSSYLRLLLEFGCPPDSCDCAWQQPWLADDSLFGWCLATAAASQSQ